MQQYETNILSPNLPDNKVLSVAIKYDEYATIKALSQIGINSIPIYNNVLLKNNPVAAHADVNLLHITSKDLILGCSNKSSNLPLSYKLHKTQGRLNEKYPGDVLLNAVRIGDKLICNTKTIDKSVLEFADKHGLIIIHVNQGYAKCSICVVTDSCIITDDESIYKSTQDFFNDVLFIEKGSIRLEGLNYGFIGGATGKIDKNKIAFNGRIESHTNHNQIIDLLTRYKIEPVELIDDVLTDIGSIIPLTQRIR